jgi:probable DNA metabolism protein
MSLTKDTTSHFLELASRHKKSLRDDLIPKVKKVLNENPTIIYNKLNKMARQFYLRGREVLGELHRLNAFIRFKVYPEYLLVSEIRPEHDIIDLMFNYFHRRYPDFIILFYEQYQGNLATKRANICFDALKQKRNYWFFPRQSYTLDELRGLIRPQLKELFAVEDFSSEVWERYYDSQYIKERKNIKLARKALPKKMIEKSGGGLSYEALRLEEEENSRQMNSLLDYL